MTALSCYWLGEGMTDGDGKPLSIPKFVAIGKAQVQRWATMGIVSGKWFAWEELESKRFVGEHFVPDGLVWLAERCSSYKQANLINAAVRSQDHRFRAAWYWEVESNALMWDPTNVFLRDDGSWCNEPGFRAGDMHEFFLLPMRARLRDAGENVGVVFEKTLLEVERIATTGIEFKVGNETMSAEKCRDMYRRKVHDGVAIMATKFEEVFSCWWKFPLLFAALGSRALGPSCARFIVGVILERKPSLLGHGKRSRDGAEAEVQGSAPPRPEFTKPDLSNEYDRLFADLPMAKDEKELERLVSWAEQLDLCNEDLWSDLSKLSSVKATSVAESAGTGAADSESATNSERTPAAEFKSNYPRLYVWFWFNIVIIAVVNLIVELAFSHVKHSRQHGEGQATTDSKMAYQHILATRMRDQRRALGATEAQLKAAAEGEKTFKHNDTRDKAIAWVESVDELIRGRYGEEAMANVSSYTEVREMKEDAEQLAAVKRFVETKKEAVTRSFTTVDINRMKRELESTILGHDAELLDKANQTARDVEIIGMLNTGHWTALKKDEYGGAIKYGMPGFAGSFYDTTAMAARVAAKGAMGVVREVAAGETEVSKVKVGRYGCEHGNVNRFVEEERSRTGPLRVVSLVSKTSHVTNMVEIRRLAGHFASDVAKRIYAYLSVPDVMGKPFTGRRWWLRFSNGQFPYMLRIAPPEPRSNGNQGDGEAEAMEVEGAP